VGVSAAGPVRLINHVSVTTADLGRSLAFYADLLGLEVLGRGESHSRQLESVIGLGPLRLRWAELDLGAPSFLELFEYVAPRGTPLSQRTLSQRTSDAGAVHFALTVDDLDALYPRLLEAGVRMRSAPVRLRTGTWVGAQAVYVLDPDGATVELVQFPDGGLAPAGGANSP
jgi:glyoxylase I family protein